MSTNAVHLTGFRRSTVGLLLLALFMAVGITTVFAPRAEGLVCEIAKPKDPFISSGDVTSSVTAVCDSTVRKTLGLSVRRLKSFWPDVTVATGSTTATSTFWSTSARGCEAPGAIYKYRAKGTFSGLSAKESNIVSLQCT